MIRAVFFDLDGTLYDRDAAIRRLAEEQFETFRQELRVEQSVFMDHLLSLDAHGHNRTPRLHHALAETLGFPEELADRLERWFRSRYVNQCSVYSDAVPTLEALRSQGIKLGIITNGPTEWQSLKIDSMGIALLFDVIVISGAEGVRKPDPRIFALALERCGVSSGESIFVGDHPEADIAGAKAAGLLPVWKRMPYWKVPSDVVQIDRLSELLALV
jgi:putative hydrolase of the HAD superfamily